MNERKKQGEDVGGVVKERANKEGKEEGREGRNKLVDKRRLRITNRDPR